MPQGKLNRPFINVLSYRKVTNMDCNSKFLSLSTRVIEVWLRLHSNINNLFIFLCIKSNTLFHKQKNLY
jgi:hypothetical protein